MPRASSAWSSRAHSSDAVDSATLRGTHGASSSGPSKKRGTGFAPLRFFTNRDTSGPFSLETSTGSRDERCECRAAQFDDIRAIPEEEAFAEETSGVASTLIF